MIVLLAIIGLISCISFILFASVKGEMQSAIGMFLSILVFGIICLLISVLLHTT